jgi:hypothetical protein
MRLANFRVGLSDLVVGLMKVDRVPGLRHIKVNSYFREGRIVRSSMRGLKPGKRIVLKANKIKTISTTKIVKPKRIKPPKVFNYLSVQYNNRYNFNAKEELVTWSNTINNMKPAKPQLTEWDDTRSIINYINDTVAKQPNKFRSVSVNGTTGAMATISKDVKNKAIYVENLVANPNKFNNPHDYSGAGTTLLLHLIEESIDAGYGGKLTLSSLPNAVKFYRTLGFRPVSNPLNFSYELSPQAAQKLIDDNLSLFSGSKKKSTAEFSVNLITQAMDLEENIVAFAIKIVR